MSTKKNFAQNLVPNHSFEKNDTCPDFFAELSKANYWFSATTGTPDYFNACYLPNLYPDIDVPLNNFGYQDAHDGVAYIGVVAFWSGLSVTWREYAEVKLLQPLEANKKYHVHFFVSLADSSIYATDAMGAYFSYDSVVSQSYDALGFQPQIMNDQGNFLTDTMNWIEISGNYLAGGGENYLLIGNFKDQQNTDSVQVLPLDNTQQFPFLLAYYWIDDVCVSLDSAECDRELNISAQGWGTEIQIGPNPVQDLLVIQSQESLSNIEIINELGQKIKVNFKANGFNKSEVDVSQLPETYYLLKIQTEKRVFVKKILVMH